ncbi:uncharacterized protein F4822DRAFT_225776 [Hypoxylon trugodes]|uniref:uncharacterized protein n=1 Tax=Hypoxylon trugodes TaxID=326681 RepID=UPI00218E0F5B|nr:uncharacterized protein F4822DRAFT_225776 [Hypoxylon trugodes]KAI1390157.1 hypothetical protein F4822DRAFT_225776 [Hypoxylon trugodes]
MATGSDLIKFDVCLYKKDDVSYEDFIGWATGPYAEQVIPLMKKHGLVKWVQTVVPPQFREPLRQMLKGEMNRPGWTVPDYDLVHTYYLRSHDDLKALTLEPKWHELEEEASKLSNVSIGHFVNGFEIVQFENNYLETNNE